MISRRALCVSAGAVSLSFGCVHAAPLKLTSARATHTMVGLSDGSALIIGGCTGPGCSRGPGSITVDRFDPKTGLIHEAGRLITPRVEGAAAVLRDGTVLIAGGWVGNNQATTSVERFDVRTGRSHSAGDMSIGQACQAMTLTDGRVALVGPKSIDLYDPKINRVTLISRASPFLDAGTATLLASGKILTVGGGTYGHPATAQAFLIDPRTGRVERTGDLANVRIKHAAVRLRDNRVLIIGGSDDRGRDGGKTRSLEVYDPSTGRFAKVGETQLARYKIPAAAVLLADGRVLVAGGAERPEIIDPKTWRSREVAVPMEGILNFTTAVALPNGDALVAGGYGERNIRPTDSAWLIRRQVMA